MTEITLEKKTETRCNLSMLALFSFIASFAIARIFSALNPNVVLTGRGFHIHHFWYGLALLAIGGWLGISYDNERINRLAAILFGAGGGLIVDEAGLLLTFGDYWTGITYTFVIIFLTFASILFLLSKYSKIVRKEFTQFLSKHVSLYFGVFLAAVSIAFIMETDNIIIITVSSVVAITAFGIVLAYFIKRITTRH